MSDEDLRACVGLVESCLSEGYGPKGTRGLRRTAIQEASGRAMASGLVGSERTFYDRLAAAERRLGLIPDPTLYRPLQYAHERPQRVWAPKPAVTELRGPPEPAERWLVIGDKHVARDCPGRAESLLIAAHATFEKFDGVLQIGDWGTFDSLSSYEAPGSAAHRSLPSWEEDLGALADDVATLTDALYIPGYTPKLVFLEGNHEQRIDRYANSHPELGARMRAELEALFDLHGWSHHRYGEIVMLSDYVGAVHCLPGKGQGGRNAVGIAGRDLTHDLIIGHTHRAEARPVPKVGPNNFVTVLNCGCSMPDGRVEEYAKLSTTAWSWGVMEVDIRGGRIDGWAWRSMAWLEERYAAAESPARRLQEHLTGLYGEDSR